MMDILSRLPSFGLFLTLAAYFLGKKMEAKLRIPMINGMMIGSALIIAFLCLTGVDYAHYMRGASFVSYFIGPATVCLAVSVHRKSDILKRYAVPMLAGLATGMFAGILTVGVLCRALGLPEALTTPIHSKSLTTAIAMEVTRILGGDPSLAIAYVMLTGMSGCLAGFFFLRVCKITDPVAQGVALGSAAHAMGVAKGLELGETQGAIAGLAMGVAGMLGVVIVPLCAGLLEVL